MIEQATQAEQPLAGAPIPNRAPLDDAWLQATLNMADMVGPITHELHNVLNNIVLQAALVLRGAPESLRDQVSAFRGLAFRASRMLSQLDDYRHDIPIRQRPIDVAALVREVVEQADARGAAIRCQVDDPLPPAWGNEGDLSRLAWLLIGAAQAAGPPVTVRVSQQEGKLVLSVEDSGPSLNPEQLDELFDPFGSARPGENSLERAVWLSIARRLQAKLCASSTPGCGLTVAVEFKPAT